MTNALAVLSGKNELSELEVMIMQEAESEENAYDFLPTRLKIAPGGIGSFVTDDGDTVKEIIGIIPISQKARAYWPPSDDGDMPPLCTSPDGSVGILAADPSDRAIDASMKAKTTHPGVKMLVENKPVPAHFDCAACPLSQWGSSEKGAGQACKSMIRLVVLIDGWATPALLTLPPTSIKPFNQFASALKSRKSAYFGVRSTLKLDKQKSATGDPYSVLSISASGPLSKEEVAAVIDIRRQYAEHVRSMPVDNDDYVTTTAAPSSDNGDEEIAPF